MAGTPEALTYRCARCGGTFGTVPQGGAYCPYCGERQAASPTLQREAAGYSAEVARNLSQADEAYRTAAAWQQWTPQGGGARSMHKLYLIFAVVCVLGSGLPFVAQSTGLLPTRAVAWLGTAAVMLWPAILIAYLLRYASSKAATARRASAGRIRVACPNCGAMGEMTPGQVNDVCGYCRAALAPSRTIMQHGVSAAALAYRRARLEKFRQERLGMAGMSGYNMAPYVQYVGMVSLSVPVGGLTVAYTASMVRGSEPYDPAIFAAWAVFLALVGGIVGLTWYRRARRTAYRTALADLVRQFGGYAVYDVSGLVEWLNRYWPDEYPVTHLMPSPYLGAVALNVAGYAVLVHWDGAKNDHHMPCLNVLLSAYLPAELLRPGALHGNAAAQTALAPCAQLGFSVAVSEAGMFASAMPHSIEIMRKSPAALHEVAPVLMSLSRFAHASGGVPGEVA